MDNEYTKRYMVLAWIMLGFSVLGIFKFIEILGGLF